MPSTAHSSRSAATEQVLINEMGLLLSEERTYYSILRTGIAIFTLPLSVIVFLLATRGYHGLLDTFWIGIVIIFTLILVAVLGAVIAVRADRKIRKVRKIIAHIRSENKRLAEIVIT